MVATALTIADAAAYGVGIADADQQAVDNVNNNNFPNDGSTIVVVENGSGGALSVSALIAAVPHTADTIVTKVLQATVANGDVAVFGPFHTAIFGATVELVWSTGTSVTAAPVKLLPTPI